MTDAHTADYARAREAFAALAFEEKLGFLLDASMLTVARSVETVGERLSEELGDLATNLRGEVRKAAEAMDDFADRAADSMRTAADEARAAADGFADDVRAASADLADDLADEVDDAADGGIEPTTERASDDVERMLDDLFGPDDDADDTASDDDTAPGDASDGSADDGPSQHDMPTGL